MEYPRRVDPALAAAGPLNAVLGQGLGRLGGIYTRCCLGSLLTLSTQQTTCVFFAAGQFNMVTEYNCNALLRWLWSSVLITISTQVRGCLDWLHSRFGVDETHLNDWSDAAIPDRAHLLLVVSVWAETGSAQSAA